MGTAYDYLIVGAGSAGCVLANRLSREPQARVLVLEAGGNDRHPMIRAPLAWYPASTRPRFTWGYRSEPEPQTENRELDQPRGRLLGGTSAINGLMYARGNRGDYDGWAAGGLEGWSYEDVLPYFRRAEARWRGESRYHGACGPLSVAANPTERSIYPVMVATAKRLGYRHVDDFHADTQEGFGTLDYYLGLAERYPFVEARRPADGEGEAFIVREPVGVVVAVVPWNNPFGIMISKIAPALLAGCTVIMKPAPETPVDAHLIAEAAEAADLPAGVLNLVPAQREAADNLVRNTAVDKVSLTGSIAAGRRVATVCGERLARYTLELGGKSPAVILDDCDIGMVAKTLARTISMSAGQICATLSRAIVSRRHKADLLEAVAAEMQVIRIGDPLDPATELGPLAMERQRTRVEDYIDCGRREGARLVIGGRRPAHLSRGYYVEPTLFAEVDPGMRIAREEIFGPVLSVLSFDSEEEAIAIANDSDYGLYSAVFTNDRDRAWRIARALRAGTVCQNGFKFDPYLPFGGFKQSGIGREGGEEGLSSYVELKSVLLN